MSKLECLFEHHKFETKIKISNVKIGKKEEEGLLCSNCKHFAVICFGPIYNVVCKNRKYIAVSWKEGNQIGEYDLKNKKWKEIKPI